MRERRGYWKCIHGSLLDDPEFQRLSPEARHTLLTLRLCSQNNRACIFRCYDEVVIRETGSRYFPSPTVASAPSKILFARFHVPYLSVTTPRSLIGQSFQNRRSGGTFISLAVVMNRARS